VIVGPDNAVWVTDQGANTVERIDPDTHEVTSYRMPNEQPMGPHTPAFDNDGILWFTGQGSGTIGRLDPQTQSIDIFPAPLGPGPYGIDATPDGEVWYVSLAQSYLANIDKQTGESTVYNPPTTAQGARRVWSDSQGRLWVSEWNSGQLSRYDPATEEWREWPLPPTPNAPQAYAVYVDELDFVWVTDFGNNQIVRFDPTTETFEPFPLPTPNAAVRQLLGREGEVWGAESGVDKLVVLRRS
jgi:virginiamycin B lyase